MCKIFIIYTHIMYTHIGITKTYTEINIHTFDLSNICATYRSLITRLLVRQTGQDMISDWLPQVVTSPVYGQTTVWVCGTCIDTYKAFFWYACELSSTTKFYGGGGYCEPPSLDGECRIGFFLTTHIFLCS